MEDKRAKAVIELREVKRDAQEMHAKFIENQCALENTTQELESLRRSFDELDLWVEDRGEAIQGLGTKRT